MLKIKPILQIQGEKLDSFAKTRTMARGTKIMKEAIAKDIKERFDDDYHNVHICVAYTYDEAPALELKKELEELYPGENIICDPLSLSVSCHIGYILSLCYNKTKKYKEVIYARKANP